MTALTVIDYPESAERYVLSYASLSSRHAAETLSHGLKAEDFYVPSRRIIFAEIATQTLNSQAFDMLSVCSALEAAGTLENVGSHAGLVDVFTWLSPDSAFVRQDLLGKHVQSITAAAARRRAVVDASAALDRLRAADPAAAQDLQTAVSPVLESTGRCPVRPFSEFAVAAMQELEQEMRAGTHITGIRSGFHLLDSLTGGFQPGRLYIIAARPGMGKTTFALDVVRHVLTSTGNPPRIAFVSAEMEGTQLFRTMLAADSQTDLRSLSTPRGQAALPRVTAACRRISAAGRHLDIIEAWDGSDIDTICSHLKTRHAAELLDAVVVDYLQRLPATGDRASLSAVEAVAEVSLKLHRLAVSLHIPVIALAQINRDAAGRTPTLKDLKGSGAIEQDADVVILLDRPELSLPPDASQAARAALAGIAVLDVAKNRSGATGRVLLDFQPAIRRFSPRPDQLLPATR